MFVLDLIFSLVIAGIFALALVYLLGRRGPGPMAGLVFFALLLFLAVWAGGLWLGPIGPQLWGVHWVAFVLVGVVVGLFLATFIPPLAGAAGPPSEPASAIEPSAPDRAARSAAVLVLSGFFWVLVLVLLALVAARYLFVR